MKVGSRAAFLRLRDTDICGAAVEQAIGASSIGDKKAAYEEYLSAVAGKSNTEAREIAKDMIGSEVFFDWDGMLLCTRTAAHR